MNDLIAKTKDSYTYWLSFMKDLEQPNANESVMEAACSVDTAFLQLVEAVGELGKTIVLAGIYNNVDEIRLHKTLVKKGV